MKIRKATGTAAVWLVAGLLGTGLAYASPADEQAIKDLVAGEAGAIKALDNARLASFFCGQFSGVVRAKTADDRIPPLSEAAGYGPGALSAVMSAAGVSGPTAQTLLTAVQNGDDVGYHSAVKSAAREVLADVTYDVHDINVTDNAATAAVTAQGHDVTLNQQRDFIKEAGQWKDCTDPEKRADAQGNPLLTSLLH
jgi:hypothetical protein